VDPLLADWLVQGLLSPALNVFATTASNATTSSYACYYDDTLKTFLGDVYSVKVRHVEEKQRQSVSKEFM
jgi:hypothetical protein